jgi:hypothetical protein
MAYAKMLLVYAEMFLDPVRTKDVSGLWRDVLASEEIFLIN